MEKDIGREIRVKGEDLLRKVKELVHQGNIRRISLVKYRFVESQGYHLVKLSKNCLEIIMVF